MTTAVVLSKALVASIYNTNEAISTAPMVDCWGTPLSPYSAARQAHNEGVNLRDVKSVDRLYMAIRP